ncbi:hypothetical protein [Aurantiacibacter sediminis]|uniref:Copper-binding protein n=1 Tax=Aurantiacibacter sediminis TaxID=2793064 RepID=A0ABS0N600_9SPHN|nr:hypothetical protein [Aurantiacibacter sediminis]MBH5323206.1 hypothetical protein [Aurantiacibacter sediminis]
MRISMLGILLVASLSACEDEPARPAPAEPIEGAITPPAPNERLEEDVPTNWLPEDGLKPFAKRTDPTPDRGSWLQQLTPTSSDNCTFTERPASERPDGLDVQAWSGNMDLLGEGDVLAHDHAIGFVEAFFMADSPVIAVRDGMPDLWIEPLAPRDEVTLIIGPDKFYCHRRDE